MKPGPKSFKEHTCIFVDDKISSNDLEPDNIPRNCSLVHKKGGRNMEKTSISIESYLRMK